MTSDPVFAAFSSPYAPADEPLAAALLADASLDAAAEARIDRLALRLIAAARAKTIRIGGLEDLHKEYADQGLVVLGFPCNQFGAQDPGSNDEIASFCQLNYGVSFPMMAKIDVNGANASPLYQWLAAEAPGLLGSKAIKWNFTKFLVGKDGRVIRRYAPQDAPKKLAGDIEAALAA